MATKVLAFVSAVSSGAMLGSSTACHAQSTVRQLLCENRKNPIGLNITAPRFSWQIQSNGRNFSQSAYKLKVWLSGKEMWSTGKIRSSQSILVPYSGPAVQSIRRYQRQVRVWDSADKVSHWSPIAFFQTGLLSKEDWKVVWIAPEDEEPTASWPSLLFRKEFVVAKKIRSASAYITARGLYQGRINGECIGDDYLTPGCTSYYYAFNTRYMR